DQLQREVAELQLKRERGEGGARLDAKLAERRRMLEAVESMREQNPMLGLRGVRLGIHMPELVAMQVRAIFEAACACMREGVDVRPKVMVPLSVDGNELKVERAMLEEQARKVMEEQGVQVKYELGTMIEVPRAALVADRIAEHAQFFSFGTNDLTQTTFGYSRDDIGKFLPFYLEKKLLPHDPFAVLDQRGVGELVRIGIERGRHTVPGLKVGICGEHGGEPSSVEFCHRVGMTYVSCSPYMVPVAWLASAQAQVKEPRAAKPQLTGEVKPKASRADMKRSHG